MKRFFAAAVLAGALLSSTIAYAAQQTVTLSVPGMYCPSCPYIVKTSLMDVTGVENVVVTLSDKTAVVTYDDAQTNTKSLIEATTNAGYPSSLAK